MLGLRDSFCYQRFLFIKRAVNCLMIDDKHWLPRRKIVKERVAFFSKQRLQLLEEATVGQTRSMFSIGERTERMMRERLAEWNASPDRVEAIVRSIRGVRE